MCEREQGSDRQGFETSFDRVEVSKEVDELKKKITKLEDIVDELRLCVKYLELDLEATKREMKGE